MTETKTIFHSDLNGFYASVEMLLDPTLRGKPVAVCGSTEERHGIVLAKSELAKRAGIKTGMINSEARRLCPELIIRPPQFEQYLKYSQLTRQVYEQFTDRVEPYGMDECWLQVHNRKSLAQGGFEIAENIRNAVKSQVGLTVSVGVSFNKVFAKLGSDLKKPDATTVITREDFRRTVWPLPTSALLYAGRATTRKLAFYGIYSVGDLARTNPEFLREILGVNGLVLWRYANGEDDSRVMHKDFVSPVKSVGHGITSREDLVNEEEVWLVMLELSQDIGHRLRLNGLSAKGIQISVKDNNLAVRQYQEPLATATQSPMVIAKKAREIFREKHRWVNNIRAVSVTAINLVPRDAPWQTDLFTDPVKVEKYEKLADVVDDIRSRFGKNIICPASLCGDNKMPSITTHDLILPGMMRQ